jgi:hypothetical protein
MKFEEIGFTAFLEAYLYIGALPSIFDRSVKFLRTAFYPGLTRNSKAEVLAFSEAHINNREMN